MLTTKRSVVGGYLEPIEALNLIEAIATECLDHWSISSDDYKLHLANKDGNMDITVIDPFSDMYDRHIIKITPSVNVENKRRRKRFVEAFNVIIDKLWNWLYTTNIKDISSNTPHGDIIQTELSTIQNIVLPDAEYIPSARPIQKAIRLHGRVLYDVYLLYAMRPADARRLDSYLVFN